MHGGDVRDLAGDLEGDAARLLEALAVEGLVGLAEALGEHRGATAVPGVGADARRGLRCDAAGRPDALRCGCRPTRRPFRLGADRALVDPLVERARLDLGLLGRRITRRPRCTGRPDLGRPLLGGGQRASGTLLVTGAGPARAGTARGRSATGPGATGTAAAGATRARAGACRDRSRRRRACPPRVRPVQHVHRVCSVQRVHRARSVRRRRHHGGRRPGSAVGPGSRRPHDAADEEGDPRTCATMLRGTERRKRREDAPDRGVLSHCEIRRRPTLPGGLPPSTIGADRLNFRVRDGNGCDPVAMATEISCPTGAAHLEDSRASTSVQSKPSAY